MKEVKEVEEVVNLMEAVEGHRVEGGAHSDQSIQALHLAFEYSHVGQG